jgi:hypothetical protein
MAMEQKNNNTHTYIYIFDYFSNETSIDRGCPSKPLIIAEG